MSVHIDDVARVDALLVDGNWLGVDVGSLQRNAPQSRSSSSSAVVYHWTYSGHTFIAAASDVSAIRLAPAEGQ